MLEFLARGVPLALESGAVLPEPKRVICWSFLRKVCRWRLSQGRFCLSLSELYVGFSCLVLLATVRGGTSFLCPTATKKQKQRKRLQTLAFR
jgi:hypothetical protein